MQSKKSDPTVFILLPPREYKIKFTKQNPALSAFALSRVEEGPNKITPPNLTPPREKWLLCWEISRSFA